VQLETHAEFSANNVYKFVVFRNSDFVSVMLHSFACVNHTV